MITNGFLKNILQQKFHYQALNSGKKLFESHAVFNLSIGINDMKATVLDLGQVLKVTFEIEEHGHLTQLNGNCTCGEPNCRHQVAVLHAAIEFKEKSKSGFKQIQKLSVPEKLEGRFAGEFRELPIDHDLYHAISKYRPKSYVPLSWSDQLDGTFLSPTEIEIKNKPSNNVLSISKEKDHIRIKMEDGKVFVKCMTCNKEGHTLCPHQMTLLMAAVAPFKGFDFHKPVKSYQKILSTRSVFKELDGEVLLKYYDVKLSKKGIKLLAKQNNILGEEWSEGMQSIQSRVKAEKQRMKALTIDRLQEGRDHEYAFVWTRPQNYDTSIDLSILFAKGAGFKSKSGIKDLNKILEKIPKGFPEPLQTMAQSLFFLLQNGTKDQQYVGLKSFIEKYIDELNKIHQYTYDGIYLSHNAPRITSFNLIKFVPEELECKFVIEVIDGMTHLQRIVTHNGSPFDMSKVNYSNPIFCATSYLAYLTPHARFYELMELFPQGYDTVILTVLDDYQKASLVSQLQEYGEVSVPDDYLKKEEMIPHPELQILLQEAGEFVLFEPRITFGEHSFNAFEKNLFVVTDKLYRATEEDRKFLIDFLRKSHPKFDTPFQVQDYVYLEIKEMINSYWFVHFNEACKTAGIEILGLKDLSKFKYSTHRADTYVHIKSGINWFDVQAGISFGDEVVKTADWIRALRNKQTYVKLSDDTLGILPEEWLEQMQKVLAVADIEKGDIKISKYRFNIIEELFNEIDDQEILAELAEKKARLINLDTEREYSLPSNIDATLREYQKYGFRWLKFLNESGFGGILADDMGLGKTIQVITLLADQLDYASSLVIVPRSLLFNWAAELDKFCPSLTYTIHHGPDRAKSMDDLTDNNIIITTYHTATNDISFLKDFEFNYIVLDESQAIKNPDSKRYKAMRLLRSRHKLAMTGTPIENNTFDLFSQLSFTSPGLLGGKTSFKNNFSVPIDNNGDKAAAELLKKLIHPFILRRTKEQVAQDLPEKTETVIYCEMDNTQRKLYERLKMKIKQDIEATIEEKGLNQSKFKILDGLLRLRQMCNSPLLVNPAFSGENANSVKINTLMENVTEAISQNHNALIFSQFVSLLSIIRKEFDTRGIKYAYLDGSTKNRQAEVEKFMEDEGVKIFLISIKAGNTGMNLTKADYVYIVDPWWNPAVEAQAIDRTHRIGQENHIFAYKLICKNSIEEKILQLQAKKKKIARDIIQTDENIMKSLNKDDLMALFD